MKIIEKTMLSESNKIEGEYSKKALDDACHAWNFAKRHDHMINIDYIKYIHFELMYRLNFRIAGNFRECKVWVGDRECLYYKEIIKELDSWCRKNNNLKSKEDIKQAHIEFEKIHPFEDGNGRVGRILMNIQRINAGLPILIIRVGEEQQQYYKWFKDD